MIFSGGLLLLLTVLAVARLTRFVTTDAVLDRPRAWVQARSGAMLTYLLGCPWCLSVWFGLPAAVAVHFAGRAWWVQVPVLGLALSYGVGLLEQVSSLIAAKHDLAEAMTEVERAAVSRPYDCGVHLPTGVTRLT